VAGQLQSSRSVTVGADLVSANHPMWVLPSHPIIADGDLDSVLS
jgi:hypothetical protein